MREVGSERSRGRVGKRGRFCSWKGGGGSAEAWREGREEGQVVTKETEGEDSQGEGVTTAEGVAIEEASEDFTVVFWGALGQ